MVPSRADVSMVEQDNKSGCHQLLNHQESPSCLLPFQEALQDQPVGLTHAPFKLLLLCRDSECVRFCVQPLRAES